MPRWAIIGIVVVAIVAAVAIGYPIYASAKAKSDVKAECDALAREIAITRVQGGDVTKAATLQAQLRLCTAKAEALGVDIDDEALAIAECGAPQEQIAQEWAHYRSTSYDDPVKRENTRSTILRLGEEMARCYGMAIEAAPDIKQLLSLREPLSEAITSSRGRSSCFAKGNAGCSRAGVNEPHGNDKAADEVSRVTVPLRAALAALNERLHEIDPNTYGAPSNTATVTGSAGGEGTSAIETRIRDEESDALRVELWQGRDRRDRG